MISSFKELARVSGFKVSFLEFTVAIILTVVSFLPFVRKTSFDGFTSTEGTASNTA